MIMQGFARDKILQQLAPLSERQRAAYATACAERLIPLYRWFQEAETWGDTRVLERGIELAWSWIEGQQHKDSEFTEAIHACEAVTPDTDDFASSLASRALDAGSAVAQALEACISPIPETAADAGEISWECAFGVEQSLLLEGGVEYIVDRRILAKAAQGGFMLLEERLQWQSLQVLQRGSLTHEGIRNFRSEFVRLTG